MTPEDKIIQLETEIDMLKNQLAGFSRAEVPVFNFETKSPGLAPAPFPYAHAFASHALYQNSVNFLRMWDPGSNETKPLKGLFLDLDSLTEFNNATPPIRKYLLMFGKKPDVNPNGTPMTVPTFNNSFFTLMIVGIKGNKEILKDGNDNPIIYEYLTPLAHPCKNDFPDLDAKFP